MNLIGPLFVKCWAKYPEHLLLPVILDHAFETICEVGPRSCVKRYFFFFCLGPDILPQFCPDLDFAIFRT